MLTLNLVGGGTIKVPTKSIISYTATLKGSLVKYKVDGVEQTVEVYEVPSRLKPMIYGEHYE